MVRPTLIAAACALAVAASGLSSASAEPDGVRLAQRWTPLTGILPPERDVRESGPETGSLDRAEPAAKSETPSVADSQVRTQRHDLTVALVRTVTDGQPHGGLDVQSMPVDADLAEALGLGEARGALVTDASSSSARGANLRIGDIIQRIGSHDVAGPNGLVQALRESLPDDQVTVEIRRAGDGAADLKQLLVERAEAGNVGAAASLGRLLSMGLVLGPRNPAEAAPYYLKAAEAGHLASMTRYALFAKDGVGIAKDEALAARWFRKAADGGQEAAMTNLGGLYEAGLGVKQDYAEAALWYRRAVEKGHVFANYRLGLLYEAGRGVGRDHQEAARLLRAASDGGLSEATSWLADKYAHGRGLPKDEAEAAKLNAVAAGQVRRAADRGNAVATFNLGILYRLGKGVTQSDTEAAYWVVKSLRLGDRYLVAELMRNPDVLAVADRKWLQGVLRDEGTYKGPINGSFSPDVRAAMEALANPA